MTVAANASSTRVPVYLRRVSNPIVFAVCSALALMSVAPVWAAEPGDVERGNSEAGQKPADESRQAAERERKLSEARKRLEAAAQEVAELSRALSEETMPRVARIMGRYTSRAMLGVNIGDPRGEERKDGVEIINVSPGGPAAKAGLKAGDVLVEIKDKSLKQDGTESPSEKLLAAMRDVEPEEKVKVRYLRDGKAATATVVADRTNTMFTMPLRLRGLEHVPPLPFMRSHGVFGSAELVALTPKLGQYFGTDKGLLVVRAPADARLKLEEGDVIIDIDGRVPTSAAHAGRILSSYQPGEKLKLNVMRSKKRMTFDITIPEDVLEHRFEGASFHEFDDFVSPPAPHAPPAAPLAPRPVGNEIA